ncbi:MAG: NAD(P)-binding domain-containing protein, partial [bacterium]|nr:NAD(P)-binding domain-containing protein [bacterium]
MTKLAADFEIQLNFSLDEADDNAAIIKRVAKELNLAATDLPALEIKKRAIDARHGKVRFLLTIGVVDNNKTILADPQPRNVNTNDPIIIIGAGPAGLFCAYELARKGIPSIILERGKKVQARRQDLKGLNQHGFVNADSNYCFG